MQLRIHPSSGVPIYRQVVDQIRYLITSGRLAPGAELPGIRALAEQLLVNPNTIARAYLELERAEMLMKRHGAGTYVAESPRKLTRNQRASALTESVDALLMQAAQLGVGYEEVVELLEERHARVTSNTP
ncbi:MAG: GntR family transcriptional regulator [Verrucomicrobiales bacterium]|nr:GntR family transcriptional regulator [Verrucomicrobiales bacterium]